MNVYKRQPRDFRGNEDRFEYAPVGFPSPEAVDEAAKAILKRRVGVMWTQSTDEARIDAYEDALAALVAAATTDFGKETGGD